MNRQGKRDDVVFSIADLAREGTRKLSKEIGEYYNEGSMDLLSLKDMSASYDRLRLRPRFARDVSDVDTSTECFGVKARFPVGFAPTAMHGLAHEDAELGTSRAAAKAGVNMILSHYANSAIEDVVEAGKGYGNAYAQQLCLVEHWETNLYILRRAEKAGCKAFVLTMDCPALGRRLNEQRNNFAMPQHLHYPNLPEGVDVHDMVTKDPRLAYEMRLDWDMVTRLIQLAKIPVWLKGLITPEDAVLACETGAAGIIISSHGGRQLDGIVNPVDALPDIVDAVAGRLPVHIDSGIRRGSDIFKALALGADYCWLGRPAIWGLAYNGEAGVSLALDLLYDEFLTVMRLCGCTSIKDIKRSHLARLRPDGSMGIIPQGPRSISEEYDLRVVRAHL